MIHAYCWQIESLTAGRYGSNCKGIIFKCITQNIPVWNDLNTLRPRKNGRHYTKDIFRCIFLNESGWISIKMSLNFVPKDPINNIRALVQIMAWRRPGNKPLSEPMMIKLPTHICVTWPQWVTVSLPFVWYIKSLILTLLGYQCLCFFQEFIVFLISSFWGLSNQSPSIYEQTRCIWGSRLKLMTDTP